VLGVCSIRYLPDIQGEIPPIPLDINNVCVEGLEVRLCSLSPNNRLECSIAYVSVCVDLSRELRGVHISRSVESVLDGINNITYSSLLDLQNSLRVTAEQLLNKHEYSSKATVRLRMKHLHVVDVESTSVTMYVTVKLFRDGRVRYGLGLDIKGMSVCPCAQQVYAFIEDMIVSNTPSHSQRALLAVRVNSPEPIDLSLDEVMKTLLSIFSTPVRCFMKKIEEYKFIKKAFENPKFAEDIAREAVYKMYKVFRERLSDDATITAKVMSYESIHPFNLYVRINHSVRELDRLFSKFTGSVQ